MGGLGNCYYFAAIGSLININNGSYILQSIVTKNDTKNNVYVGKLYKYGKIRYISVDDYIPGKTYGSDKFAIFA